MTEMERLKERLEILEEENRQLRDDIGFLDTVPDMARLKMLGLSLTGFRLLSLLSKRKMVLKSTVIQSLWPSGDEPETAMSVMSVQLHRIRKCLREYGIEIENVRGVGWSVNDEGRKKAAEIVAEILR